MEIGVATSLSPLSLRSALRAFESAQPASISRRNGRLKEMVARGGIEPPTRRFSVRRSADQTSSSSPVAPSLQLLQLVGDLVVTWNGQQSSRVLQVTEKMARPERFELPTPWFVARYSIQLSYGRVRARILPYGAAVVDRARRWKRQAFPGAWRPRCRRRCRRPAGRHI